MIDAGRAEVYTALLRQAHWSGVKLWQLDTVRTCVGGVTVTWAEHIQYMLEAYDEAVDKKFGKWTSRVQVDYETGKVDHGMVFADLYDE